MGTGAVCLQHGLQISLRDARCEVHHLPLQHLVDDVDVQDTLGFRPVPLMHCVQAQIAGLAMRLQLALLADRHRRGRRLDVVQAPFAIMLALAQVVQMSQGDRSEPFDVGPRAEAEKTAAPVDGRPHLAGGRVASDQPRYRRTAHPGHLFHLAPHHATRSLALLAVLLMDQNLLHPATDLPTVPASKTDFLAGLIEPANCFQTQLLCFVHAAVQSPACLTLQALLVLESTPAFRLILCWKSRADAS